MRLVLDDATVYLHTDLFTQTIIHPVMIVRQEVARSGLLMQSEVGDFGDHLKKATADLGLSCTSGYYTYKDTVISDKVSAL